MISRIKATWLTKVSQHITLRWKSKYLRRGSFSRHLDPRSNLLRLCSRWRRERRLQQTVRLEFRQEYVELLTRNEDSGNAQDEERRIQLGGSGHEALFGELCSSSEEAHPQNEQQVTENGSND